MSDAGLPAGEPVLEVGAGLGSLTVALAAAGHPVLAIEFDRGLIAALREVTEPWPGVQVLHADAMKVDWPSLLSGRRWRMVSNLPYNVATPLLLDLLDGGLPIDGYLAMVQREVGERLVAGPGDPGYGAVSLRVAWRARAEVARRVPASVFWPRPRVESVLVRLDPRSEPPVDADRDAVFRLVDEGFAQRRKTMANALRRLGLDAGEAAEALSIADIDGTVRAEELSLSDFTRLSEVMRDA